jgi:hypothetical protein
MLLRGVTLGVDMGVEQGVWRWPGVGLALAWRWPGVGLDRLRFAIR